jgi:hypothetical protein
VGSRRFSSKFAPRGLSSRPHGIVGSSKASRLRWLRDRAASSRKWLQAIAIGVCIALLFACGGFQDVLSEGIFTKLPHFLFLKCLPKNCPPYVQVRSFGSILTKSFYRTDRDSLQTVLSEWREYIAAHSHLAASRIIYEISFWPRTPEFQLCSYTQVIRWSFPLIMDYHSSPYPLSLVFYPEQVNSHLNIGPGLPYGLPACGFTEAIKNTGLFLSCLHLRIRSQCQGVSIARLVSGNDYEHVCLLRRTLHLCELPLHGVQLPFIDVQHPKRDKDTAIMNDTFNINFFSVGYNPRPYLPQELRWPFWFFVGGMLTNWFVSNIRRRGLKTILAFAMLVCGSIMIYHAYSLAGDYAAFWK